MCRPTRSAAERINSAFNLTPAGVLTFNAAQDFENPADTDTDGVYEVQVTANDGNGGTDIKTILVTLTAENDAPVITTTSFNYGREPDFGR